jgi:hypothetical protein
MCPTNQSGIRGVVASALRQVAARIDRHAAGRIDRNLTNNGSETKQANEFLAWWVRFAVPGMLAQGNIDAMEYAVTNIPW